jgi:hypothetical protein
MARKQLIKGANALRVEERIARVPADLLAEGREGETGQESIFRALKALEGRPSMAAPEAPAPEGPSARPVGARPVSARPISARPAPSRRAPASARPLPSRSAPASPAPPAKAKEPAPPRRIGPADFSAAERAAIIRSCTEYRNFLPIYLQSAQAELRVIDAVLAKCRAIERHK